MIEAGSMLRFGIVDQVGTGANRGRVRVRFEASDEVLSGWLFVATARSYKARLFWSPVIGESVACVTDEDLAEGIVLPHFNSQDAPPPCPPHALCVEFEDGTVLQYDPDAHELTAHVEGSVDLTATGSARLQAPTISLEGDVTIQGKLAVSDAATFANGADVTGKLSADLSSATHTHPVSGGTALQGAR